AVRVRLALLRILELLADRVVGGTLVPCHRSRREADHCQSQADCERHAPEHSYSLTNPRTPTELPSPPRPAPATSSSWASTWTKRGSYESGRKNSSARKRSTKGRYAASSRPSASDAAITPVITPSTTNGPRTNHSVAPTSFMSSISCLRWYTAVRIVFITITTEATVRTPSMPRPAIVSQVESRSMLVMKSPL